jgi:CheY-like chemotaxis protein
MNILVVDDNSDYRFLLSLALARGGYVVDTAEDGAEAIEILDRRSFDLIVSDIRMPLMDGIKLHAYVRDTPKHKYTKFIFVSGYKEIYGNIVVLDPVLDFFRDKTTPTEDLLGLVNTLLKKDQAGESIEVCKEGGG